MSIHPPRIHSAWYPSAASMSIWAGTANSRSTLVPKFYYWRDVLRDEKVRRRLKPCGRCEVDLSLEQADWKQITPNWSLISFICSGVIQESWVWSFLMLQPRLFHYNHIKHIKRQLWHRMNFVFIFGCVNHRERSEACLNHIHSFNELSELSSATVLNLLLSIYRRSLWITQLVRMCLTAASERSRSQEIK